MTRQVYTPEKPGRLREFLSPAGMIRHLWPHRELIRAYADRQYEAAHRHMLLGAAWSMLTPLILLALFTFVFGYIFQGRFNTSIDETPMDFALALFVGLSLYLCIGQALTGSPNLMFSNAAYVKTLAFPLEIIPVAEAYNIMRNLLISIGLCLVAFLLTKGYLHWTTILILPHILCVAMLVLGLSWFLSALAVFVPDTPSITGPLSMVLMFLSGVFFSIDSMPSHLRILFQVNPLATIIAQVRSAILYGEIPDFRVLAVILVASFLVMMGGYAFFNRTKTSFADVI